MLQQVLSVHALGEGGGQASACDWGGMPVKRTANHRGTVWKWNWVGDGLSRETQTDKNK